MNLLVEYCADKKLLKNWFVMLNLNVQWHFNINKNLKNKKYILDLFYSFLNYEDPWLKEKSYRAASSRWWGDSVVAGPGRGSPQRVGPGREPPAVEDAEPNPHPWVKWNLWPGLFHRKKCWKSSPSRVIKRAGKSWRLWNFKWTTLIARGWSPPKRRSQTKNPLDRETEITENWSLPQGRPQKRNME